MWIMSQDKKSLINADESNAIYCTMNIGKKKSAIMSFPSNTMLGAYDNEKCALCEIENLAEAIKSGEKFYNMP